MRSSLFLALALLCLVTVVAVWLAPGDPVQEERQDIVWPQPATDAEVAERELRR